MNLKSTVTTALIIAAHWLPMTMHAAISLSGPTYTQKFDTINGQVSTAGVYGWTDDSTLPGWCATVNGAQATQYRANNGGETSSNPPIWFMRSSGTEAALGSFNGTNVGTFGTQFINNTGGVITQLEISFRGEQWSYNTGAASRLTFQYSLNATSLLNGTWTNHAALDFASLKSGNSVDQPIDGNVAGNNIAITASINSLSIQPGQTFWLRWAGAATGRQALAIDDFTLRAYVSNPNYPVSILPADALQQMTLSGGATYGNLSAVYPVTGQPFAQARTVTISVKPAQPYDTQLSIFTSQALAAGDAVRFTFYLRGISKEMDDVRVDPLLEQASSPYTKYFWRRQYAATTDWKRYDMAFVSPGNYPAGSAVVHFRCGFQRQSFELGGIDVQNYGNTIAVDRLPNTVTYGGQGADAAWRVEAASRIEQYRKGNLTINVRAADGTPIENAAITVEMVRNAFGLGSAVRAKTLLGTTANEITYQNATVALFNQATLENDLKWPTWESNPTRPVVAVDWLRSNHIDVRGHNLLWPKLGLVTSSTSSSYRMPADCVGMAPDDLRNRINTALHDRMSPFVGELMDWDVLNEAFDNYDVQGRLSGISGVTPSSGILGNAEILEWFRRAESEDPSVKLFLNDNIVGINNGQNTPAHDYIDALIRYIKDNGTKIDALGIQGHFRDDTLTDMSVWKAVLDRYSALGVRLKITEFDFYTGDAQLQAAYLRDVLTVAYAHPAVDAFVMWGFWDGDVYQPGIGLFAADWTRKPAGDVWQTLAVDQWRTDASGTTNASGQYSVRCYTGEYVVGVSINGTPETYQNVSVTPAGASVTTQAPPPPAAPASPSAIAGDAQVALSWSASTGATSYRLKRATVSGGPYSSIATTSATSTVDTAVANGTIYYYVVTAVNAYGESANSGEASATPQAVVTLVSPTNLTATKGKGKITLTWTQSTSANIQSNKLYRSAAVGGPFTLLATFSAKTSYSDPVATGSTYYYVVTAVNATGVESGYSNQAGATAR